ncbi:MAG: 30S ribosomal protein S2 [Candidatus Pacebacteria bacterium]|nr:30S ribosomal protein S2 [Candidatus Paceibacterota bacterium]MCF7856987.1 30S ribosomal protein S2 [Candidatus Paceibacterota bacterium]
MNINHTSEKTLIERLFDVGAHFGFTKSRRHPTAAPYIFGNKQGTDIIDLEKTVASLEVAKNVLKEAGKAGKTVLFVGTKEEIVLTVKAHAESIEMPYVVNRWVGGMLTNFSEIKKRIQRLSDLTAQGESGELERKYTKKERVVIGREFNKLTVNFGGIQKMDRAPYLMVIVDPRHDSIAVSEARELNIPVVGITSSDANLRLIKFPVVVNDGLQASVALILSELTEAYTEGKTEFVPAKKEEIRKSVR